MTLRSIKLKYLMESVNLEYFQQDLFVVSCAKKFKELSAVTKSLPRSRSILTNKDSPNAASQAAKVRRTRNKWELIPNIVDIEKENNNKQSITASRLISKFKVCVW